MFEDLEKCSLFRDINQEDIGKCLSCSGARKNEYQINERIFSQEDIPKSIFILTHGKIAICRDSISGKRNLIVTVSKKGEIFGESYAFLEQNNYGIYAVALMKSTIYEIPKFFLSRTCRNNCLYHNKVIYNMLHILASKTYFMNQKIHILSGHNLRQKIAMVLMERYKGDSVVMTGMNREELADYLGTARPSLSRELMKMQEDGLIEVHGKNITVLDVEEFEEIIM